MKNHVLFFYLGKMCVNLPAEECSCCLSKKCFYLFFKSILSRWSLSARCWCSVSHRSIQVPAPPIAWPPLSLLPAVSRQRRHCRHYWAKPRPHCQVRGRDTEFTDYLHLFKTEAGLIRILVLRVWHTIILVVLSLTRVFVSLLRAWPRWLSLPMSGELTERKSFLTVCLISSNQYFEFNSWKKWAG